MSTTVTLQLNATDAAGDWATRTCGDSRTGTGSLGDGIRATPRITDDVVIHVSELRGAVEAIRRGPSSINLAETRSDAGDITWGTPALYCGMRFAISFA